MKKKEQGGGDAEQEGQNEVEEGQQTEGANLEEYVASIIRGRKSVLTLLAPGPMYPPEYVRVIP